MKTAILLLPAHEAWRQCSGLSLAADEISIPDASEMNLMPVFKLFESVVDCTLRPMKLLRLNTVAAPGVPEHTTARLAIESRALCVVDVREFLSPPSVDGLTKDLATSGVELEVLPSPDALPVWTDRTQMQRLLEHVISLARRMLPAGSILRVLARLDSTHAVLNLADAALGPGDPVLGKLFHAACIGERLRPRDENLLQCIRLCERMVSEQGGRMYAAPSPLASLGITVRLPIHRAGQRSRFDSEESRRVTGLDR